MRPAPQRNRPENKKKILSNQDIKRLARIQQARLIIALNEAKTPLNMRQLSGVTGIEIPSLCRRISELQKQGFVERVYFAPCPISRYPRVGYYAKKERG